MTASFLSDVQICMLYVFRNKTYFTLRNIYKYTNKDGQHCKNSLVGNMCACLLALDNK